MLQPSAPFPWPHSGTGGPQARVSAHHCCSVIAVSYWTGSVALASGGCGRRLAEGSHLQPPCRVTRNPTAVCAVAPQIVIQDGLATKWLFTSSKTGEVLKKRSVENKSFIVETFVKAALSDPANTDGLVGVLWAKSPSVAASPARVLAKDDFEEFMKSMAGSANDLCALQVRDGAHSPVRRSRANGSQAL